MKSSGSKEHFAFVDCLRGVASLLVAVFHMHLITEPHYSATGLNFALSELFRYFDIGKFGVAVFFLVSGYLVPLALDRAGGIRVFAKRRFFRLYPVYWFSIGVMVLVGWLGLREMPNPLATLANLTMLQAYLGQPDINGAFWTLNIEMTFYILCCVLFALGWFDERRWLMVPASLVGGLALAAGRWWLGKQFPVALFLALALMFAADALRRGDRRTRLCLGLVAVGLVPICLLAYGELAIRYIVTYWAAMIVFLSCHRYRANSIFEAAFWKPLADMSYGLYVLHPAIGMPCARIMAERGYSQGTAIFTGLILTMAASYVVYHAIEKPCIEWGRGRKTAPAEVKPA